MERRIGLLRVLITVPLLAAGIGLAAPRPAVAATECVSQINTRIRDSVVVRANTECELTDVVVRGGVTIEACGALDAENTEFRGSVSGTNIFGIGIVGGVVRGSVTVASASVSILDGAEVRANTTLTGVDSAIVLRTIVRGSLILNDNHTAAAQGNTVAVDLSCSGNDVVEGAAGSNSVGGAKLGQCAGL